MSRVRLTGVPLKAAMGETPTLEQRVEFRRFRAAPMLMTRIARFVRRPLVSSALPKRHLSPLARNQRIDVVPRTETALCFRHVAALSVSFQ
jgi:hypothetical protein